jgi:CheY-like chemotaxis protein
MPPPLVLIVDDDAERSSMLVRLLQAEGWNVEAALKARNLYEFGVKVSLRSPTSRA